MVDYTILNDYTITETGTKKYSHKLSIGSKLKYQLKKHCNYKTFTFYYGSEQSAMNDIKDIQAELHRMTI